MRKSWLAARVQVACQVRQSKPPQNCWLHWRSAVALLFHIDQLGVWSAHHQKRYKSVLQMDELDSSCGIAGLRDWSSTSQDQPHLNVQTVQHQVGAHPHLRQFTRRKAQKPWPLLRMKRSRCSSKQLAALNVACSRPCLTWLAGEPQGKESAVGHVKQVGVAQTIRNGPCWDRPCLTMLSEPVKAKCAKTRSMRPNSQNGTTLNARSPCYSDPKRALLNRSAVPNVAFWTGKSKVSKDATHATQQPKRHHSERQIPLLQRSETGPAEQIGPAQRCFLNR